MNKYILLFFLLISCASCEVSSESREKLCIAEDLMSGRPDSAYTILSEIDAKGFSHRKDKAKYALLFSMALDKNYIDVTDDSLIRVAVDYYKNHGTIDDRLKSLYYSGVIYLNKNDMNQAMNYFVKAERYVKRAKDKIAIGRLYMGKKVIYQFIYDFKAAEAASLKAAKMYYNAKDTSRYINAMLDVATYNIILDRDSIAFTYLSNLKKLYNFFTPFQKSTYYADNISIARNTDKSTLPALIEIYLSKLPDQSIINWIVLSNAYVTIENFENAQIALNNYVKYNTDYHNSPQYYYIKARIEEHYKRYNESLSAYKQYLLLTDAKDLIVFDSDAGFMDERDSAKLRQQKQSLYIIILSLSIICVLLTFIITIGYGRLLLKKKREEKDKLEAEKANIELEKNNYKNLYNKALDEQENLLIIYKNASLDEDVKKLVDERLRILNKFVAANISSSFSKTALEDLSKLMGDKNKFLDSTRLSFAIAHPKFLSFLKKKGLSDWEIGCCCLYCAGLNGKEISSYLNIKGYYNISSSIRTKLGLLEYKTNLDLFLNKKMSELDKKL